MSKPLIHAQRVAAMVVELDRSGMGKPTLGYPKGKTATADKEFN